MQINRASGTNFTGVIPVRVLQNGKEVLDKNIVHKSCLEVIKGLSGPLHTKPEFKSTAAQLSVMDHDYKYARAFFGYSRLIPGEKLTASKFFKIIFDKFNRGYIVTGKPSEKLSELGKSIGKARGECKLYGINDSPALETARKNYWDTYKSIGNDLKLRIREAFSPSTLEKYGNYQQMDLHITTKPQKIRGREDSKVIIENIVFSDRNFG